MAIYSLSGMNCGNCVKKVSALLSDVTNATVSLNPPRLNVPDASDPGLDAINAKLAPSNKYSAAKISAGMDWLKTYYPLFLIIIFISAAAFKDAETLRDWMMHFMAGFFLVFSFFKLLNVKGFADAYASYDMLAKRWHGYGYIYPFIELAVGFAFLFQVQVVATLTFAAALMLFSSIGVIQAVLEKKKIRCACLGTTLNLPMSTITIIEDLGMAFMSVWMLLSI